MKKRPVGRPSAFTEELVQHICEELANDRSVKDICENDEGMPHLTTVQRWIQKDSEFAISIARAREHGAERVFDDIRDIEEKVLRGELNSDQARVVISAKQWRAGKMKPKKYGDIKQLEVSGGQTPIQVQTTRMLDVSKLSFEQLEALHTALVETGRMLEGPVIDGEANEE